MVQGLERRVRLFPGVIVPYSLYLAMVKFPHTQSDVPNGAKPDGRSTGSIEDTVMGSNEPQLSSIVYARNGRNGGFQYTTAISGLSGVKQQKPLGITQILRDILGLPTEFDRLNYLISLEEGRHVRGQDQVTAAYHLSTFYGLAHYSEKDQRRITMAVLDCINRFCKSPLDLERSIQITDSIIEGFGLESMPRLMRDYRPFRNLSALVPNGDVHRIASAMNAPGLKRLPVPALMQELGYTQVRVGEVPVLYHRFITNPSR